MVSLGFPSGTNGKNTPVSAGEVRDTGSIPGSGRSPGKEHSNPLQYSPLENPKDRGAWRNVVHRDTKSWTQLKQLNTHDASYFRHPLKVYFFSYFGGGEL